MHAPVSRRAFLQRGGSCALAIACAVELPAELAGFPVDAVDGHGTAAERTYPIPAADGVSIDRAVALILVRLQGHAYALRLNCPHQNAAVKWVERDGAFQCTKHNSRYRQDGTYVAGKSTRSLDRFAIRRDGANLIVDLDRVFRADQDAAGWAGANVDI